MSVRLLSNKLRESLVMHDGVLCRRLTYWCAGCEDIHSVWVEGQGVPVWGWNGDAERPSFTPSVKYETTKFVPPVTPENIDQYRANPWHQTRTAWLCHTHVGNNGAAPGEVMFLNDCTHALRGAHALPDLPARHRGMV